MIFSRRAAIFAMTGMAASAMALPAFAHDHQMRAVEAYELAKNGDIILLDIRSPQEWKQTGVGEGVWPVTLHDKNFARNLQEIMAQNPGTPVAMICATGGRTKYVQEVLAKNGVTGIVDVSEGMMGSPAGAGWLKLGLPVVKAKTAQKSIPAGFKKP